MAAGGSPSTDPKFPWPLTNGSRIAHGFAMSMVVTAGIAADLCALPVLSPGKKRQVVHGVENSPLRWLQSVARVWQRARNDHRHRVVEKGTRYFFSYVYRLYFFVGV